MGTAAVDHQYNEKDETGTNTNHNDNTNQSSSDVQTNNPTNNPNDIISVNSLNIKTTNQDDLPKLIWIDERVNNKENSFLNHIL
jgi:hypothetical protein